MQMSNPSAVSRSPVSFWRKSLLFQSRSHPSPAPLVLPGDLPAPSGCLLEASGYSDQGCVRSNNEDYFRIEPDLGFYAVADGMGGADAGEYASHLAGDTVVEQGVAAENRGPKCLPPAV